MRELSADGVERRPVPERPIHASVEARQAGTKIMRKPTRLLKPGAELQMLTTRGHGTLDLAKAAHEQAVRSWIETGILQSPEKRSALAAEHGSSRR